MKRRGETTNLNPQFKNLKCMFTILFSAHKRQHQSFITHFSLFFCITENLVCTWFMNLKWNVNRINFARKPFTASNSRIWGDQVYLNTLLWQLNISSHRYFQSKNCMNERTSSVNIFAIISKNRQTETDIALHHSQHKDSVSLLRKIEHFMHFKWRNTSSKMHRFKPGALNLIPKAPECII